MLVGMPAPRDPHGESRAAAMCCPRGGWFAILTTTTSLHWPRRLARGWSPETTTCSRPSSTRLPW